MRPVKLIVTDIDNTIFDWISYYVHSLGALFANVAREIGCSEDVLRGEAKQIFSAHASIEYPFLIQEMPTVLEHYGSDIDGMLSSLVEPSRLIFKAEAEKWLVPYPNVLKTFKKLKELYPSTPIVALTDAPRYVAMWKLNKLGLLGEFSAVYGLADPRLPTDPVLGRVKVTPKILLKHLQQSNFNYAGKIRILPDEYEKPGVRGLKTVLMDYDLDESKESRGQVIWVGDNLRKDVGLGKKLGVQSIWASYGTKVDPKMFELLRTFSPDENVEKNIYIDHKGAEAPVPDFVLDESFAELIQFLD